MTSGFDPADLPKVLKYRDAMRAACAAFPEDPFILAALGLRESDLGWGAGYEPKGDPCGWGDNGHAFGLFQLDRRYHSTFIFSTWSADVVNQAGYALKVLHGVRDWLLHSLPELAGPKLMEASLCGYNANEVHVLAQLQAGADPNLVTTGKDYGRWVLAKADALRSGCITLFASPSDLNS